jgi:hypothetical protein
MVTFVVAMSKPYGMPLLPSRAMVMTAFEAAPNAFVFALEPGAE